MTDAYEQYFDSLNEGDEVLSQAEFNAALRPAHSADQCREEAEEMNRVWDSNVQRNAELAREEAAAAAYRATLCKGFAAQYISGGVAYEKLYAVLPDGRVFRSEELPQPNPVFDEPGRNWTHIPDLNIDDVASLAVFCGYYEKPARIK